MKQKPTQPQANWGPAHANHGLEAANNDAGSTKSGDWVLNPEWVRLGPGAPSVGCEYPYATVNIPPAPVNIMVTQQTAHPTQAKVGEFWRKQSPVTHL